MKVDKITFKENQAWITIRSEEGEYLGVWHTSNPELVKAIRDKMPKKITLE